MLFITHILRHKKFWRCDNTDGQNIFYALILNDDPTVNLHLPPVGLVNIVEHLKYLKKS